ncbi:hypothetical protein C8J56DRAFT_897915 [Mycena floridula]|nr:hypothetical protein C8J56DRAFT_897915 [Mycena floridula]
MVCSPKQVKIFHAEASPPHISTTSSSIIPHSSPPKYLWHLLTLLPQVWQTHLNESFPMLIKAFDLKYLERLTFVLMLSLWLSSDISLNAYFPNAPGLGKLFEGKKAMWEMDVLDLEDLGEDFQVMNIVTQAGKLKGESKEISNEKVLYKRR